MKPVGLPASLFRLPAQSFPLDSASLVCHQRGKGFWVFLERKAAGRWKRGAPRQQETARGTRPGQSSGVRGLSCRVVRGNVAGAPGRGHLERPGQGRRAQLSDLDSLGDAVSLGGRGDTDDRETSEDDRGTLGGRPGREPRQEGHGKGQV